MSVPVVVTLAFITALAAFGRAWLDHITLKRKLDAFKRQTAELKRTLDRRGQLAGEIAHEIKNPITAIQCSAQTLELVLGKQLDTELRKSIQYISEYSDHLVRLLSDFLEVSRCEAGVNLPRAESVLLRKTIESVTGLLQSSALRKHLHLRVEVDSNSCVWADPRQLKQILFNLVHNGIKFTPENGTISVAVTSLALSGRVAIAVSDTGPGIPNDQLATIFDPYSRFERGHTAVDTGIGLGLALCRNLAELNGGTITVQSDVGKGSRFTVILPQPPAVTLVSTPALTLPAPAAPALYQPLLGQHYLLVDEDNSTRDAIARLIQAWGGAVDQVAQATEAIEAINGKAYDAVMVDTTLDGLSGYELASLLRDNAHANGTSIIVATKSKPDAHLALECGADHAMEKPLKGDRLLQSLLTVGKWHVTH
ncbi:MAG: hybrid sensor histidine kinase/response regulator [Proteobacteria bacterium]|nr:hybrid sensor histidine kinase/response regulator [Pseudomonadota bacterium]